MLYASREYTTAVDIWAVGAMFGEMLLGRPMFPGENDIAQIHKISQVRGSIANTWPSATRLPDYDKIRFPQVPKIPLKELLPDVSMDALDLLEQMLHYDPSQRCSTQDALTHDFFFTDPLPEDNLKDLLMIFQLRRAKKGFARS